MHATFQFVNVICYISVRVDTLAHCKCPTCTSRQCHICTYCDTLCTATHFNTLQHAATHCNTLQHSATHCNTLQHTATHCNTLQHTAPHCNTLQPVSYMYIIPVPLAMLACAARIDEEKHVLTYTSRINVHMTSNMYEIRYKCTSHER